MPPGAKFTSLSGQMVVPPLPRAATYYLWPGLQPTDGSGVYQNVLDGRKGQWWFGSGWCCSNPNLPWGGGFNTVAGEVNTFNNSLNGDNSGWTSTTVHNGSAGSSSVNAFPLGSKSFNQAIFAVELCVSPSCALFPDYPRYDVTWDFGPLTFKNVKIWTGTVTYGVGQVATGSPRQSWCTNAPENYNKATKYTVTGAKASVSGTTVTCTIDSIVLQGPA
ncbi:hypothetical protein QBC46DRAFT_448877 [Diplogelasinospora grovesii]|uniref:Uncharacterized protein n=1 Tax=Diplogelasinospora grovesii TaxID=303347 RepID=A0AAN6N9Q3_9PEZI|nr:hypothetical protein QBC46DRAFT_448877 [Diplogelasinospora grovesii]